MKLYLLDETLESLRLFCNCAFILHLLDAQLYPPSTHLHPKCSTPPPPPSAVVVRLRADGAHLPSVWYQSPAPSFPDSSSFGVVSYLLFVPDSSALSASASGQLVSGGLLSAASALGFADCTGAPQVCHHCLQGQLGCFTRSGILSGVVAGLPLPANC